MERPRSGTERTPCCRRAHRPNEQTTLQAGSDTKLRRTLLAAYFRIADFTSEPKAYRARNRRFESISLHGESDELPHCAADSLAFRERVGAATSRNIALSSIASANSFFSLVFSSSSAFSRRASEASIPPYLAFPFVKGRVADAVFAAHLNRLRSCLLLPQDRDDLLLTKPAALHRPFPSRVGLYLNPEEFQGLRSFSRHYISWVGLDHNDGGLDAPSANGKCPTLIPASGVGMVHCHQVAATPLTSSGNRRQPSSLVAQNLSSPFNLVP